MAIEPITEFLLEGSLNHSENPAAKRLLDAIVASLAEEYIETAKANPDIFTL